MTENVVRLFKAPPTEASTSEYVLPHAVPDLPEPSKTAPATIPLWVRSGRAIKAAATHERTRTAGRVAARHSMYVAGGARIVARRAWDGRTAARYERMIRVAEVAGQIEEAKEWEERGRQFRAERHQRRMELLAAPQRLAKATAVGAGWGAGTLLAVGATLAVSDDDPTQVITPIMATVDFIHWLSIIVGVVWGPMLAAAPWIALLGLWDVGRRRQAAPQWALPANQQDDRDVVPDEGAITAALRHLGIGPLNRAFKDGWQPRWVSPTTRLGKGYHTQLLLPQGVTVEMVNGKKKVLAHNLLRKPVEVWPTEPPKQPGVLDLWVADQGSLSEKVAPWPLLTEGTTDYFKGVPVAVSQRGEPIIGKLMAANYMVGGIMGSGKSSLVIALLLGAILDPLVEVEAYVMAYNVDYDPLKPRMRALVKGDEDEQIEVAVNALRRLRDEVTERGKLLEELGGETVKLTRELALRDPRMRPKVVVFDECHELFMHKTYGKEAAELAVKVMKKARKVGITLIWVTVSPTADSIPRDVTRNTSHRVAFAVGDHIANDGLLGSGKHKAGITATTLIPGEDVGTAVTVGFTSKPFEVVRSHYVARDPEKGIDEVTPVVERAIGLRDGVEPLAELPTFQPADPLADVAAVLGDEPRVLTQEVLHRLAEHNPEAYREWGFADLKRALEPYGAEQYKSGGKSVVARDRVHDAILERLAEDADEEGDDHI
ncbi:FtsK/SpoIIIE domain-containing protein [Streptomyces sp. ME19-01-6]|uniref:FtsK/SpoIIIE domain-containing protein n=1 Tax=Streptomyces sp. ME19-01-6 TaxID=3028686 RepID=UPI0029B2B484|nr:FtsK/SpoIIIE domain-containing protein [Streptomyces sp. ME19-01-6]MDX3229397.1 FtsK/SpoIIIE domain-containing protein [Streptomyces sp. ME19-01-6]